MLQGMYNKRLREDLPRWIKQGWVSLDGARAIAVETEPPSLADRLPILIGLLGTLLIGFAAFTFFAANWEQMPRVLRLAIILAGMLAFLLLGFIVSRKNHYYVEEAVQLLSAGFFGAAVFLVADMYYLNSELPFLLLIWGVGCFFFAILLSAKTALCLGFILIGAWSVLETIEYDQVIHWWFLIPWAVGAGIAVFIKSRVGLHLTVVSLIVWAAANIAAFAALRGWPTVSLPMLFVQVSLLALAVAYILRDKDFTLMTDGFQVPLERYSLMGVFGALFALQHTGYSFASGVEFFDEVNWNRTWLVLAGVLFGASILTALLQYRDARLSPIDVIAMLGAGVGSVAYSVLLTSVPNDAPIVAIATSWIFTAVYLALCLWVISFGHRRRDAFIVNMGLFAFAAEVLYIYWRLYNDKLVPFMFYIGGGVLLLILAFVLSQIRDSLLETSLEDMRAEAARKNQERDTMRESVEATVPQTEEVRS